MDPSRISLRPFKLSDVDDFLKWASDDRVTRYLRWSSVNSREEALTYLEKVAIHHPWRRSICLDDHSIGYISISPESGDDRCRARLGYALAAEFWGQGIATIALKMAVSSVFKELAGLVRVHAVVEVENKGSQRVLGKKLVIIIQPPGRQQRSVLGTFEDGEAKVKQGGHDLSTLAATIIPLIQ
uniref:N-acetyltransferase domain-containing protein n=2 Tax=Salix TaxID=40685 RepID=A0A6N2MV12_SALVM